MKKNKPDPKKAAELRKKAEKKLASRKNDSKKMSDSDSRELIHELRVHQIELEMQNEELRQTQEALEKSRQRYADLFDYAPVGYFNCDESGKILEANFTLAEQLDVQRSQLIGKKFYDYIHREDKDTFYLHLREVFKRKKRQNCEIRLTRKDGSEFYAHLESTKAKEAHGQTIGIISVTNITRLKQTKNELRNSLSALEMMRDIAFMANRSRSIEKAVEFCLKRISEHNGWSFGHAFLVSEDNPDELVPVDAWYASAPQRYKRFRELTMNLRLKRGQGLPGRVFDSSKAEWTKDLHGDLIVRRMSIADQLDLKTAAAFPIIVGKKIVGVLEFFSDNEIKLEQRILQSMTSVGTLLGRVIERENAERQIIEEQHFVKSIANSTPNIIFVNDLKTRKNIFINRQLTNILGYSPKEIGIKPPTIKQFVHPEDIESMSSHLKRMEQARDGEIVESEHRIKHANGEWRWINSSGMVFKRDDDGSVRQYIGVAQDVTERKKTREELIQSREKLRELNTRLQSMIEEERSRIAREIHDQLGQALTALQMDISWCSKNLPKGQERFIEKAQSMSHLIQMTSQAVKEISMKLRPSVLDDLGLVEALKWEAKKFEIRAGIQCEVTSEPENITIDPDLSTNIFRIFQEALTNVSRHAQATKVNVLLRKDRERLMLKIVDNGIGISEDQADSSKSMGLIGMQERLRRWGGVVNIYGKPNKGTTVEIHVSLTSKLKILIADDHQIVRQGLKQILSEVSDIEMADEAADGYEVLSKVWKNDYDMLLLDLSMPGRSGLEILEELKSEKPNLPILILSVHSEELYAVRALKAGASGYLSKESAQDELVTAIRKVATGRKYITPDLAEQIAADMSSGADKPPHEKLSTREYQIMEGIAQGKSAKQIADSLSLSASTIHTCRTRMLEKMGMKNDQEVIRYAIKHGLVE